MEQKFKSYLSTSGVEPGCLAILEEENILNFTIFTSLREEHFEKLLPLLKVGEHAMLLKLWETYNSTTRVAASSREVSFD